jgi:putative ABC transport system substrate-binding protein
MNRRELLTLLSGAALAGPQAAMGQTSGKIYRLGVLSPGPARDEKNPDGRTLIQALADRGFERGKNLTFDAHGTGAARNYAAILDQMKAAGTDVVVTLSYPVAAAAKASGMPVVIAWGGGDPVATKLIDSLARPGGNVTGISDDAAAISTKRLSLLKQMLPNMRRVAMLWNREDLGMTLRYGAAAQAAQALGVEVQALGVREPDDFNGVFEAMDRERPDAILMVTDILTVLNRKRVFDYATAKKIPAIYEDQQFARDGGLMAYGADPKESFERAADCCVRIFKGARPADIPFEQPTRYPFVINLKTAKAIGLEVPATLVALADEVIE